MDRFWHRVSQKGVLLYHPHSLASTVANISHHLCGATCRLTNKLLTLLRQFIFCVWLLYRLQNSIKWCCQPQQTKQHSGSSTLRIPFDFASSAALTWQDRLCTLIHLTRGSEIPLLFSSGSYKLTHLPELPSAWCFSVIIGRAGAKVQLHANTFTYLQIMNR